MSCINRRLELLVDAEIVAAAKLGPLRREWSHWGERHRRQSRDGSGKRVGGERINAMNSPRFS